MDFEDIVNVPTKECKMYYVLKMQSDNSHFGSIVLEIFKKEWNKTLDIIRYNKLQFT